MKQKKLEKNKTSIKKIMGIDLSKQKERGITLIALVVTIIVLLILAGVSIQMLTGQTGILTQAQQARENTRGGEVKDAVALAVAENELAKNTGNGTVRTKEDVVKELEQDGKLTEQEVETLKESDQLTIGSIDIDFSGLEGGTTGGEKVSAEDMGGNNLKDYQGSYVDIGLDINGTNETEDDWKLFYAENGRIFLIAADYVPVEKLKEWEIIGQGAEPKTKLEELGEHGLQQYNNYTYSVYWGAYSSGAVIPWMELPTTPSNFMELVKHTGYDLKTNKSKPNAGAVSQLLNTDAWSGIKTKAKENNKIDFCIGGPTLEMWCAAWNASNPTKDSFTEVYANEKGSSGYYVGNSTEATTIYYYMNGGSSLTSDEKTKLESNYSTFFPHTSSVSNCYGYWLASPSASGSSALMYVSYNGSVGFNSYRNSDDGVRPVVCLTSGVQLQKNEEKSDDTKTIYDLV